MTAHKQTLTKFISLDKISELSVLSRNDVIDSVVPNFSSIQKDVCRG